MIVPAWTRTSPASVRIVTPSASSPVTMCPVSGVAPRLSSAFAARLDSFGGNADSTRSPASTSSTRAFDVSMLRKSLRVSRAISAI